MPKELQERASKGAANIRLKEQLALPARPVKTVKKREPAAKTSRSARATAVADADEGDGTFGELEVESIVGKGLAADGSILYQVRWRGYGEGDDTWEPLANLTGAKKAIQLFEADAEDLESVEEGTAEQEPSAKAATNQPKAPKSEQKDKSLHVRIRMPAPRLPACLPAWTEAWCYGCRRGRRGKYKHPQQVPR